MSTHRVLCLFAMENKMCSLSANTSSCFFIHHDWERKKMIIAEKIPRRRRKLFSFSVACNEFRQWWYVYLSSPECIRLIFLSIFLACCYEQERYQMSYIYIRGFFNNQTLTTSHLRLLILIAMLANFIVFCSSFFIHHIRIFSVVKSRYGMGKKYEDRSGISSTGKRRAGGNFIII